MDYKNLTILGATSIKNISCPICLSKHLVYHSHSDIPAFDGVVICGRCGSVFKSLIMRYDTERKEQRVVGGTKIGMIKQERISIATVSNFEWADGNEYYEPLAEPITFGEQLENA